MLTKRLNFDDDVLGVLRSMDVQPTSGGFTGFLHCGQLERKLYERTNKALEALGGKWNRKAGGHVFPTDPREQFNGLLESGSLTVERDGFFETPRSVVLEMLEHVPFKRCHSILEPSAGFGAIANVLREHGAEAGGMKLIEKNEQRADSLRKQMFYVECADFLEYHISGWDRIYMNPPFEAGQDIDHVLHAYGLLSRPGAMVSVMSEGPFFRNDSKSKEFRDWLEAFDGKSYPLPDNSFKDSGTGVNTRLIVIWKH